MQSHSIPVDAVTDSASTHRYCRRCGGELERVGAFYWHVGHPAHCPITAWPAGSMELPGAAGEPLTGPPAPTTYPEGVTLMSKRGGNKTKRPPKPPMANKGPKAKMRKPGEQGRLGAPEGAPERE